MPDVTVYCQCGRGFDEDAPACHWHQDQRREQETWYLVHCLAADLREIAQPIRHQGGSLDYDAVAGVVLSVLFDCEPGDVLPALQALAPSEPSKRTKKANIGKVLRTTVMERDLYRCVICATHLDLTIDHIIPESKGGPTEATNLQTLCRPCNSKKGTK